MIKGLIFDLDGVITDTAIFHYESWKEIADQFNIDLTETVNEKIKGFPRTETLLKIFEIYDFDYSEFDESKLEKICDVKNETYLNLINSKLNEDYILFGIKNLLQEAKSMNLKIALASSSKNAPLILDKLKIKSYFDFIANPSDVKNSKPAPDLYLLAAKGLNLLPSECVGFEDAMIGIQGLNDANIFSVGISLQDDYVKNNSKYFVKDTKELNLKDILDKANN
ncbi:MAG: beta-phosphoglucomutase [Malacoplasma sp.]